MQERPRGTSGSRGARFALPRHRHRINPRLSRDKFTTFGEPPVDRGADEIGRPPEKGIDFIAHDISQTASNTAGIHGTGAAYAQQVDFGLSFDLAKLGVWPDAVARYAMTDRAGVNLTNRTQGYFPYQSIFGQGQNLRFNEISVEKYRWRRSWR